MNSKDSEQSTKGLNNNENNFKGHQMSASEPTYMKKNYSVELIEHGVEGNSILDIRIQEQLTHNKANKDMNQVFTSPNGMNTCDTIEEISTDDGIDCENFEDMYNFENNQINTQPNSFHCDSDLASNNQETNIGNQKLRLPENFQPPYRQTDRCAEQHRELIEFKDIPQEGNCLYTSLIKLMQSEMSVEELKKKLLESPKLNLCPNQEEIRHILQTPNEWGNAEILFIFSETFLRNVRGSRS